MKKSLQCLNTLRFLTLLFSFIGLGCHFAQCTLLNIYQKKTNIPSWFTSGHWQYLAWYVLFSLSVVSALAVCAHSACCKRGHILRGDKCLGTVNIAVSIIVIVANTFMGGQEPWTNGIVEFKKPAKGFITHCSMLDQDHDATYPLLTQRCLLLDSTYIVSIAVCLLWIILVLTTCMIKPNKRMFDSVPILPNEIEKSSWKLPPNHYNHSRKPKNAYTKKYATPIAPHIEKLELPGSYDHHSSNQLSRHQIDRYSMLSRQYPPPSTIPGAYVSPTNAAAPTIYYS